MASNNQDTQEIATNTSNLHLTSRVRVELDSTLKGQLKALSKLTIGTESANHYTQLPQTSTDNKRPPKRIDIHGHT